MFRNRSDRLAGAHASRARHRTSLDRDSDVAETRDFIAAFEAKAGFGADMVAASGHTAVMVAVAALGAAGSDDPAAIRDAIAAIKGLTAATGTISFNGLGEVRKAVQVQVVRDGKWRRHSVIDDSDLLAPPTE